MEKFIINYGTGVFEEVEVEGLEQAQEIAVEGMSYTQTSVKIEQDGEVVSTSMWYGVAAEEDDEVLASFGSQGFFGEWN